MKSNEAAEVRSKPNRLIAEKSPYLLQHAYNPVDWHPWGAEAFEKARREGKPILLSIGYSTCHWCHVMEKESFEDPEIASIMNKYLVSIKLDREERPDLDRIYMTAVNALTGSGGWPLNVFLTPDLKPFWGGTYFPPHAKWDRAGWAEIVEQIGQAWNDPDQREKILSSGKELTEALSHYLSLKKEPSDLNDKPLKAGFKAFVASYDSSLAGFGPAPKFPMPVNQNFLFRYYDRARTIDKNQAEADQALTMALETLRAMARGGICDQLGGGFHRYSTDERWHVPHFEKMLYDNAQLAVNYLEAYQITHDPMFAGVARETLDYVARDMTHPEGGFCSAEDADSIPAGQPGAAKTEGAFYTWTQDELAVVLDDKNLRIFCYHYGVRPEGNVVEDPQGVFGARNILYRAHTIRDTAERFSLSEGAVEGLLAPARRRLFAVRCGRPRPQLDDKVLCSWNGLMISAFARAHQILGDAAYLKSARRAAECLQALLWEDKTNVLYRRWREGQRTQPGFAEDYAFLAQGLLDLYEASFEERWLDWAENLANQLVSKFYDRENGGFYMTSEQHEHPASIRVLADTDNVEPSASSVAVLVLLRLARITDHAGFRDAAENTLKAFARAMQEQPRGYPQMLSALDFALRPPLQIVLAGAEHSPEMRLFLEAAHQRFLPHRAVIVANAATSSKWTGQFPFLKTSSTAGPVTAYVCLNYACRLPTSDVNTFAQNLDQP